ncbi:microcin C ABC transporter permease YejB [Phaeospirillum tilakii]|uniref:Microcin C ABC transporter permease YejB n=1 Tax=Phaeospirillum tilakii TaxID=741673 RepID=A0ABW5CDN2_9PROT
MIAYTLRRLLLIPVTLFGIMLVNFMVAQFAPGGPVELMLAKVQGSAVDAAARVSGAGGSEAGGRVRAGPDAGPGGAYRGAQGLDPAFVKDIERQFGFDKPPAERFWLMMGHYLHFEFGSSFYRDVPVTQLVIEKMPVSVSLGLWSTLIIYLVSIPLGIAKATRDGSRFDLATSWAVIVGYAVPGFLFAILLIVLFAGGSYFSWFPLRGLTGVGMETAPLGARLLDYAHHLVLPVTALVVGGFASLTMLTKNAFLDEIGKQYVVTARAKGLSERQVLYRHVFRNAMLLIIAGFPRALVAILFTGSLLVEIIFSLDGIGLLGFEAVINRDYPVMFGTLYAFSLLGLGLNLISDLTLHWVDPRIDFSARGA